MAPSDAWRRKARGSSVAKARVSGPSSATSRPIRSAGLGQLEIGIGPQPALHADGPLAVEIRRTQGDDVGGITERAVGHDAEHRGQGGLRIPESDGSGDVAVEEERGRIPLIAHDRNPAAMRIGTRQSERAAASAQAQHASAGDIASQAQRLAGGDAKDAAINGWVTRKLQRPCQVGVADGHIDGSR